MRQIKRIKRIMGYDKIGKPGMLTYEGEELVRVRKPDVIMEPSRRQGVIGRIMDRILGPVMKPHVVLTLDKEQQERMREHINNFSQHMDEVAACGVTAEQLKEATDRMVTLARGHHIRKADGTVTDVSDNPMYNCNKKD